MGLRRSARSQTCFVNQMPPSVDQPCVHPFLCVPGPNPGGKVVQGQASACHRREPRREKILGYPRRGTQDCCRGSPAAILVVSTSRGDTARAMSQKERGDRAAGTGDLNAQRQGPRPERCDPEIDFRPPSSRRPAGGLPRWCGTGKTWPPDEGFPLRGRPILDAGKDRLATSIDSLSAGGKRRLRQSGGTGLSGSFGRQAPQGEIYLDQWQALEAAGLREQAHRRLASGSPRTNSGSSSFSGPGSQ